MEPCTGLHSSEPSPPLPTTPALNPRAAAPGFRVVGRLLDKGGGADISQQGRGISVDFATVRAAAAARWAACSGGRRGTAIPLAALRLQGREGACTHNNTQLLFPLRSIDSILRLQATRPVSPLPLLPLSCCRTRSHCAERCCSAPLLD